MDKFIVRNTVPPFYKSPGGGGIEGGAKEGEAEKKEAESGNGGE